MQEYKGPLTGINVLDFGHYYAGPMAAMLLAEQGANVVRIVQPGKQELPNPQYRQFNKNKKLLTLDLKTPEGRNKALMLAENADVVIENFRPGVMKRLGLDYASLKTNNPGLVYLSLPGFASTDKERAHLQAWEGVLAAAAGLFTELSLYRSLLNYPPVYTAIPVCSAYGAMQGVVAAMAALLARENHGYGTVIEAPLATCGATAFSRKFFDHEVHRGILPQAFEPFVYQKPASSVDKNADLELQLRKASEGTSHPAYTFFPCADGRRMCLVVGGKWLAKIVRLLGVEEKLYRSGLVNAGAFALEIDNNMDTMTNTSIEVVERELSAERREYRKKFFDLIAEAIGKLPGDECEELLRKAGIPCGIVRSRHEWLSTEPLLKSGILVRMNDGQSELTVPGRLVDVDKRGGEPLPVIPEEPAQVSLEEALRFFSNRLPSPPIRGKDPKQKKGDLLKGVKVLDLGNILAGPIGAHILAEYGANVIKSDCWAYIPGLMKMMIELNQGKRSILNDVKTAPGRKIFEDLLRWADVVTHNILDDTGLRMGVTPSQLKEINPNLVSCQISAFGGTLRGYWENYTGFDHTVSASSGLMARYGGSLEFPQFHGRVASGDVPGGAATAFAALLGLYQKSKTGYAGEGRTSLARANSHMQLPWMILENGRSDWGEPHGQLALGPNFWQRLYECKDGWIFVGTTEEQAPTLTKTVTGGSNVNIDIQTLEKCFLEENCGYWLKTLVESGIAAHRVNTIRDIRAEASVHCIDNAPATDETASRTFAIVRWENHPCGYPIEQLAADNVRIGANKSWKRLSPAPRLGAHTEEILREQGYSDEAISEYLRVGACFNYYFPLGDNKSYFSPGDWKNK